MMLNSAQQGITQANASHANLGRHPMCSSGVCQTPGQISVLTAPVTLGRLPDLFKLLKYSHLSNGDSNRVLDRVVRSNVKSLEECVAVRTFLVNIRYYN